MDLALVLVLLIYFIPTMVGWKKKHSSGIIVLNIFLGWTFFGWVGALIWALTSE